MVKMFLFSVVAVAVVEAAAHEETEAMLQASRIVSIDGPVSTQTGNVGGHFNEIASILQTRQTFDNDLTSAAVGDGLGWTDSTWFNAQLAALTIEGEDIYADIKACMVQNPKESLVEAARESHSKCREAELGMVGMNLTKDCEDSKKSDCDEMQSTFELATCTHSASQAAFSKVLDACLAAASHVVTKTGVQLKEANLKEEFVHYKQFQCRMSKWPLTPEEKQECKNLNPDTSHLSVSYPSKPSTTQPAKLVDLPGDVAWLAGEYTSKNWSPLVKDVTACAVTPGSTDCIIQSVDGTSQFVSRASTFAVMVKGSSVRGCAIRANDTKLECWGMNFYADFKPEGGPGLQALYDGAVKDFTMTQEYLCAVGTDNVAHVDWKRKSLGTYSNVKFCSASGAEVCMVYLDDKDSTCVSQYGNHTMKKNFSAKAYVYNSNAVCGIAEDDTLHCPGRSNYMAKTQEEWESWQKAAHGAISFNGGDTWETGIKVKRIDSSGSYGMCAIKWDDTLMCSSGSHAPLANLISQNISKTLKVKDVSIGDYGLCAVRMLDSKVQCWWSETAGRDPAPETPADLGKAVAVRVENFKGACAQLESGKIQCWGNKFSKPPSDLVAAATSC